MVDVVEKLISGLKLSPYIFFGLAIATGIVLFSPAATVATLGVRPLVDGYRVWIGGVFILSASIFVSSVAAKLPKIIGQHFQEWWNLRKARQSLLELSDPERSLLAQYVRKNTTTLSFAISDGIVGGLVGKTMLYRASNVGHPGSYSFDYNVQPWVWREISRRPELVGIAKGSIAART